MLVEFSFTGLYYILIYLENEHWFISKALSISLNFVQVADFRKEVALGAENLLRTKHGFFSL